jgi:hypothetical protein
MRRAIRQVSQITFGADAGNAFEPLRGPADVTYWPLNPVPPTNPVPPQAASEGAKASVNELKAAMTLAGLSGAS